MRPQVILALAIALAAPAAPARAATGETHWDSRLWEVKASGLPATALSERPDWADRQIVLDGKILWVVAIVPRSAETWADRVLIGSRQAADTLEAYVEYLTRTRAEVDPPDYRERRVVSARHRLRAGLDPEGFLRVETSERPRAVWMRFGYPAEKVQHALGFEVPGVVPLPRPRPPLPEPEAASPLTPWDYVWEVAWLGGLATVTVMAVLFAQATQK
ncbi:MAG: hypothetical protein FJZ01_11390 [Candidatus Sericytochromatia bacterium]|nr:hypothetical protein [Candidatus Tanganyikabacteria bacterium]